MTKSLLPVHNRKHSTPNTPVNPTASPSYDEKSHPNGTLARHDRPQFMLLILLYLLQGVPVGLAFGSIPFLLKSELSYSQVATFSLASYPYSLKLLWSPIVDALYIKSIGRRKSWIIPIQLISGISLMILGSSMDTLLLNPAENLARITWSFFFLVFLCATQDIAVDGWALTILSPESLSYASTAQTIGLNTGYFLSFTVFLAFNSEDFSNKYLRSEPLSYGIISINGYLFFWGIIYVLVTIFLMVFVKEEPSHLAKVKDDDIIIEVQNSKFLNHVTKLSKVYSSMFQVLRLPAVQWFILIHLVSKFGFQANESATNLKLLEKGFAKEDLAITVLIDFPFEIIFGYYVAKMSTGSKPLNPWMLGYCGRLLSAALAQVIIWAFPSSGKVTKTYFVAVILQHLLGSFMGTIQFVSINAFHTKISDPLIGGTYMTTLNTVSNLGGQWPRFMILNLIDYFTVAECRPTKGTGVATLKQLATLSGRGMKEKCMELNGEYFVLKDGYYVTNAFCVSVGLILFFGFIRWKARELQALSTSAWRVNQ